MGRDSFGEKEKLGLRFEATAYGGKDDDREELELWPWAWVWFRKGKSKRLERKRVYG